MIKYNNNKQIEEDIKDKQDINYTKIYRLYIGNLSITRGCIGLKTNMFTSF